MNDLTVEDGTGRLGRDRLLTGRFEDSLVDSESSNGALWRYGDGTSPTTGQKFGVNQSGGAKLSRHTDNTDSGVITPIHRLPIASRYFTLTGLYRYYDSDGVDLHVMWYDENQGESFESTRHELGDTGGEWERFTFHLEAPARATHVNFFVFLESPEQSDIREVALDDLRLIEWAGTSVTGGRQYDHLFVDGQVTADFASSDQCGNRSKRRKIDK